MKENESEEQGHTKQQQGQTDGNDYVSRSV